MEPSNFRSYDRSTDTEKYNFPSDLPLRPGTNSQGKAVEIRVNQFKVVQWPGKDVYQYDVSTTFTFISRGLELTSLQIHIGNGAEKRGKILAIWKSRAVQNKLKSLIQGPWLWDGNKLAW
jgi:eukaryotic translation initiation factor 2C